MSLHDELDDSFVYDSVATSPQPGRVRSSAGLSLATELEHAMNEDSYESDSSVCSINRKESTTVLHSNRQSFSRGRAEDGPKCRPAYGSDYSGGEWGDPAYDSDPDGRFLKLDRVMDALMDAVGTDLDSAYMSDEDSYEMSRASADGLQGEVLRRFTAQLQGLQSQSRVESTASLLSDTQESIMRKLQVQLVDIRDLFQTTLSHYSGAVLDSAQAEEIEESVDSLLMTLPLVIDTAVSIELSLLEAETNALIADLYLLNDTLQEFKQVSILAQRSLKAARDICDQWKSEINQVERAHAWLSQNEADFRISGRAVSKELVTIQQGFEAVCAGLRQSIEVN